VTSFRGSGGAQEVGRRHVAALVRPRPVATLLLSEGGREVGWARWAK
jgi:hypothetical protein